MRAVMIIATGTEQKFREVLGRMPFIVFAILNYGYYRLRLVYLLHLSEGAGSDS